VAAAVSRRGPEHFVERRAHAGKQPGAEPEEERRGVEREGGAAPGDLDQQRLDPGDRIIGAQFGAARQEAVQNPGDVVFGVLRRQVEKMGESNE
jgi:hypothetical protein